MINRGTSVNRVFVALLAAAAALLGSLALASQSQAAPGDVGNPSPAGSDTFTLQLTGGNLRIGTLTPFDIAEVRDKIDPTQPPTVRASISRSGAITVSKTELNNHLGTLSLLSGLVQLQLSSPANWTGQINPATGETSLNVLLGATPTILGTLYPCTLNIPVAGSTDATSASSLYSRATGNFTVFNSSVVIPAISAADCGGDAQVASDLGAILGSPLVGLNLPTRPGDVQASFVFHASPTVDRSFNPDFTVTPNAAGDEADLHASDSDWGAPGDGPLKYAWSINGSAFGTPATSADKHITAAPGSTNSIRLRIQYPDGTTREKSRTWSVPSQADLKISAEHGSTLQVGHQGTFKYTVENIGDFDADTSSGSLSINIALPGNAPPAGNGSFLLYVSDVPTWNCSIDPGIAIPYPNGTGIRCTYRGNEIRAHEESKLTLAVRPTATGPAPTSASLLWAPDANAANNGTTYTAGVGSQLSGADLAVVSVVATDAATLADASAHTYLRAGLTGKLFVHFTNAGDAPITEKTTVSLPLPQGVTVPSATTTRSGTCSSSAGTLTCTYNFSAASPLPVDAGAPINATIQHGNSVAASLTYAATVATLSDTNPTNNVFTLTTSTRPQLDLAIDTSRDHIDANYGVVHSTYTLKATGPVPVASGETTQVSGSAPAGLEVSGARGDTGTYGQNWTCTVAADRKSFNCATTAGFTKYDQVRPVIVSYVAYPSSYQGSGTINKVTVSAKAQGTTATDSNSAAADLTVDAIDVAPSSISGPSEVKVGNTVEVTASVKNVGSLTTSGAAYIRTEIPAGVEYTGATGTGWSCNKLLQLVACSNSTSLAKDQSTPPLKLSLKGKTETAAAELKFDASSSADAFSANNKASHALKVTKADPPVVTCSGNKVKNAAGDCVDPPVTTCEETNTCGNGDNNDVVSNPGEKTLEVLSGSITLGSGGVLTGKPDGVGLDLPPGFRFGGEVDKDGNVTLPGSKSTLPSIPVPKGESIPFDLEIKLVPVGDFAGRIDPANRSVDLSMAFKFDVGTGTSTLCTVGSDANPIYFKPLAGNNYEPGDGTVTLKSNVNLSVGHLAGCPSVIADGVKSGLGVGTPGAKHTVIFNARFNPPATTNRSVIEKPRETTTVVTNQTKPGTATISSKNRKLTVKRGRSAVKLTCAGDKGATCEGKLALSGKLKARGKKAKTVKYSKTVAYKFTVGQTKSIALKLTSKAAKALASSKHGKLVFKITAAGQAKSSSTGSLKLSLSKAKRKSRR